LTDRNRRGEPGAGEAFVVVVIAAAGAAVVAAGGVVGAVPGAVAVFAGSRPGVVVAGAGALVVRPFVAVGGARGHAHGRGVVGIVGCRAACGGVVRRAG